MKKILILVLTVFLLCGCKNINKMSVDDIKDNSIKGKAAHPNTIRVGYKYYKPELMSIIKSEDYNEVLRSNDIYYYLYVDLVSYYNKKNNTYEENDISYYYKKIDTKKKKGYIEINEIKDNQYLIEIMYNYAKIEVMVSKKNINSALAYSLSILTSIKYNDKVIESTMGKSVLSAGEEPIDIFKTVGNDKKTLKYVEDSKYDKDVLPDMDLVN